MKTPLLFAALLLFGFSGINGQNLVFAPGTISEINFRAAELKASARVVILSPRPGLEDIAVATLLRAGTGHRVLVAFLSNGEYFAESYERGVPNRVAAHLRMAAAGALRRIDAEHLFLNMPAVDAAIDSTILWGGWNRDTLYSRFAGMLDGFKPDVVLLSGFESAEIPGPLKDAVFQHLQEAVRMRRSMGYWTPKTIAEGRGAAQRPPQWLSLRSPSGFPLTRIIDTLQSDYARAGLSVDVRPRRYRVVSDKKKDAMPDVVDPRRLTTLAVPPATRSIDSLVQAVSQEANRWKRIPRGADREKALFTASLPLQQIDVAVFRMEKAREPDRRILLDWRSSLERIRGALLGVRVHWRVGERILTNLQLTALTIDSVEGLDPKGVTEIFFPNVQKGWVINEGLENRVQFTPGLEVSILSSKLLEYDLPRSLDGLSRPVIQSPWHFFVVHQSQNPLHSFSARVDAGFLFRRRFTTEVHTPIIRAFDGVPLTVEMVNTSRDGFRDYVWVEGDVGRSQRKKLELREKDSSFLDTLSMSFPRPVPEGVHIMDVVVGAEPQARIVVRAFECLADTTLNILIVDGPGRGSLAGAVEQLGVRRNRILPHEVGAGPDPVPNAVLVDAYTGRWLNNAAWRYLSEYAESGGRLVVVASGPEDIPPISVFAGLQSERSGRYDTTAKIIFSQGGPLMLAPNDLTHEKWDNWVYSRSALRLSIDGRWDAIAQLDRDANPVIVRRTIGKGSITVVTLNLHHQLLNVLPSGYRLLANLLSY